MYDKDDLFLFEILFFIGVIILLLFSYQFKIENNLVIGLLLLMIIINIVLCIIFVRIIKNQETAIINLLKSSKITTMVKSYEKRMYSKDIADIPWLARLVFNFNPLAITQPKTVDELYKVLEVARMYKIPLIPRGAATSGYGGLLPIKGGIMISMIHFNSVIELNENDSWVEVESGMTWRNLQKFLMSKGFELYLYPSSAPSSHIGGWIASGGYGIGSTKYGPVENTIKELMVISINGKTRLYEDISPFIGSSGTLGIIYSVRIRIKKLGTYVNKLVYGSNERINISNLERIKELNPYYLRYEDKTVLNWKNSIDNIKVQPFESGRIEICFEGETWNKDEYDGIIQSTGLKNLPDNLAKKHWDDRFYTIRLKRKGPSLVMSEVTIPLENLNKFLTTLRKRYRSKLQGYDILVTSDNKAVVMALYPTDSRKLAYILRWLYAFDIIQTARKYGGTAYASGLWLSIYSSEVYAEKYDMMKKLKKELDPDNLLNPGKVFGPRVPRFLPIFPYRIVGKIGVPFAVMFMRILEKLGLMRILDRIGI